MNGIIAPGMGSSVCLTTAEQCLHYGSTVYIGSVNDTLLVELPVILWMRPSSTELRMT